jgi:hypothetical protein
MPELEITCPRTQLTVPTGIADDVQGLVLTWALKLNVRCPPCGEEHCASARRPSRNLGRPKWNDRVSHSRYIFGEDASRMSGASGQVAQISATVAPEVEEIENVM